MQLTNLPRLGAALSLDALETHRDWVIEGGRDLEIQSFDAPEDIDGDVDGAIARAKRLLDGYRGRLGIHGPFWGFRIDSHDRLIRDVVRRRLMDGLAVCERLGATQMVIHSPFTTWDHANQQVFRDGTAIRTERVHDTLRAVVRRAEDIGVTLVIENIEDVDPLARVNLARSFDSANVKVSLDTGHAQYAHASTGAPPVDVFVMAAGDLLEHVHLQDADGFADRHWPPGMGAVNWRALFAALGRLNSNPRLVLELADPAELRRGAEHLAELGLAA
jgi:sugar phosphate isomerase/epimerase